MNAITVEARQAMVDDFLKEIKALPLLCPQTAMLVDALLIDKRWLYWPASISKHHCWPGGLLDHVREVFAFALALYNEAIARGKILNLDVLVLGVLFHDYGKFWDYVRPPGATVWTYAPHKHRVHYLPRSAMEFHRWAPGLIPDEIADHVEHLILSHHHLPEWGSPVSPQTPEAWILHLADMASVQVIAERKNG